MHYSLYLSSIAETGDVGKCFYGGQVKSGAGVRAIYHKPDPLLLLVRRVSCHKKRPHQKYCEEHLSLLCLPLVSCCLTATAALFCRILMRRISHSLPCSRNACRHFTNDNSVPAWPCECACKNRNGKRKGRDIPTLEFQMTPGKDEL